MKLSYENEDMKKALLRRGILTTCRRCPQPYNKLGLKGENVKVLQITKLFY